MAERIRVVIFDSQITAMNFPGGEVWRWSRQRSLRIERLAKSQVGKRSWETWESIEATWEGSTRDKVVHKVSANSAGAVYHHQGTNPYGPGNPVRAKRHAYWRGSGRDRVLYQPKMRIPAFGEFETTFASRVNGQPPNRYLSDPLDEVMRDL